MNLPRFKPNEPQPLLFDMPCESHGYARVTLGDFVEELTAKLISGQRFATDSRCNYCPDVYCHRNNTYYECKSMGLSHEFLVYGGRLVKDREFAKTHKLEYCVWHHHAETKKARTVDELRALFLGKMQAIYFIPFSTVDQIASEMIETRLNSQVYGDPANPEYRTGYRIPIRQVEGYHHTRVDWITQRRLFT